MKINLHGTNPITPEIPIVVPLPNVEAAWDILSLQQKITALTYASIESYITPYKLGSTLKDLFSLSPEPAVSVDDIIKLFEIPQ